jgi:hypothetical protein
MRHPRAFLLSLCVVMAFIAACPHERPPDAGTGDEGAGDAGTGDAGLSCSPEPSGGAPWAGACVFPRPVDPCSQLVLPDAGPVPSAEAWAEESSRIRCAAWVAAGTLDPSVESLCVSAEAKKWDSWVAEYQAGYRTYWPEAAWACLNESGRPDAPACGCVFSRGGTGAPCGSNTHCREGYCLKDANGVGTCVQCPPLRPPGSTCGEAGQAPCEGSSFCIDGCCVQGALPGERCGGPSNAKCDPELGECYDPCVEGCRGAYCRAYKQEGESCGTDPHCIPNQLPYCNAGTCAPGLVCTYPSALPKLLGSCHSTGLHCNERLQGCGPNQRCVGPDRLCITLGSLGPGEPCLGTEYCAEGLRCLPEGGGADGGSSQAVCGVLPAGRCLEDSDCPWAQLCVDGQCTTPQGLGATCDSYADCGPYLLCALQADGGVCTPRP